MSDHFFLGFGADPPPDQPYVPRLDEKAVAEVTVALAEFASAISAAVIIGNNPPTSSPLYAEAFRSAGRDIVAEKTRNLVAVFARHFGMEGANGNKPR